MKLSVFYDHILQALEQEENAAYVPSMMRKERLVNLLREIRSWGIEAVEIRMEHLLASEETLMLLAQAGLHISCVYEFYDMGNRDETKHIERHIEAALAADAKRVLVVPGFLSEEEARQMQAVGETADGMAAFLESNASVQHMIQGLTYAVQYGNERGITVTVEDFDDRKSPLSRMYGIRYFLDRIPALAYTLDMGNFIYSDEDVLLAWEVLQERIAHVHCKDRGEESTQMLTSHRLNLGLRSVASGDGYLPMGLLIKRLKKKGYEGYLAIEHFDAPEQKTCIRRSAEFLQNAWVENA